MLHNCKNCGSKAITTHTQWAGNRVECESECSFTSGHDELKDAIKEWDNDPLFAIGEAQEIVEE